MKRFLRAFIPTIIIFFIAFYVVLPPINIKSSLFWVFFLGTFILFTVLFSIFGWNVIDKNKKSIGIFTPSIAFTLIMIIIFAVLQIYSIPFFHSKAYSKQVTIEDGDFTKDVSEISFNQIPVVDRDTAARLGARKMGEVVDLISQFEVSDYYTQINVLNKPVRVSPLRYADFLKWLTNNKEGIPAYIKVDMTTQETTLVQLKDKIMYSPWEYFNRDIERHIRFKYPTLIFDDYSFEIDDDGKPYWVVSVMNNDIGVFGGRDVKGAVLVDAHTGETTYFPVNEVPNWIDRVYPSDLVVSQIDNWGQYKNGFWNSKFGQKNVLQTTDGYNYLAINDDVWLYTGLTSVVSDESNIGFVLSNLRTKETKFYSVNGAEEYSAMESAEGKVQEKGYKATFPILLNIDSRPTYFLSLKDNAGLVKQYAFVSVENYQIVGTADTIEDAKFQYEKQLGINKSEGSETSERKNSEGEIDKIINFVQDGNTIYYITLKNDSNIYEGSVENLKILPLLNVNDKVKIEYVDAGNDNFKNIKNITK